MSLVSIDYLSLPTALLPQVKEHCRAMHGYDDTYLTTATARAIQHFEIKTETKVFAAEYTWTPTSAAWCDGRWRSPISPVKSFKAMIDAVDVSADYRFETASTLEGAGTYYLYGANSAGLGIEELKTGYTDVTLIPPGILDRILHIVATYYENRELFIPGGQFLNPQGENATLAGWWVPKA